MKRILRTNMATLLVHVLILVGTAYAKSNLKQIHVITRHGERTQATRDSDTFLNPAFSTLTPIGQKTLYEVGQWLRERYNVDGFLEYYDASESRFEAADSDPSVASANSLGLGLFPYNAQAGNHGAALYQSLLPEMPSVPVYTFTTQNDIYIRAYRNNCPKFHSNLQKLFESTEWRELESTYNSLLTNIASLFPAAQEDEKTEDGAFVLKHLWNYYDRIHVARNECLNTPNAYACTSLGADASLADQISDIEFGELEVLMGVTEQMKFGITTAKDMLGSPLLWRMISRIDGSPDAKFFLYSGQAPTMLGLMSTLQTWQTDEPLPSHGSAMIMEVWENQKSKEKSLKFLYKSFESSTTSDLAVDHMNCDVQVTESDGSENTHCGLSEFVQWASNNTIQSVNQWCTRCENYNTDVCLRARYEALVGPLAGAIGAAEDALISTGGQPVIIALTFFLGAIVACLIFCLVDFINRRKVVQGEETNLAPHRESTIMPVTAVRPKVESSSAEQDGTIFWN